VKELPTRAARLALLSTIATSALGGVVGGLLAAAIVVGFTEILKGLLAIASRQQTWVLIVAPLIGLALSVLVLYGFGLSSDTEGFERKWASAWRTFAPRVSRPDLTGDMVGYAGEEERFPWRLAPIRMLAMIATVGFGSAMGTEAPAAYLGLATGAALGDRWWRRLLRPAAVGGGAAGVSALIGIPLLGTAYILELGKRHHAPLNTERVTAALVGGYVGWLLNLALGVNLFTLVIPRESPHSLHQAIITALLIGALSGAITALSGAAIYKAKTYTIHPILRLTLGGLALGAAAVILAMIAAPSAAIGPGSGAINWAQSTSAGALTILAVDILRAVATTSSAAAGGCGGLFIPFLAIGDLAGRVFSSLLRVPGDLAGAAGAAGGISGGYHLTFTAIALVLEQGGPPLARVTLFTTVLVAAFVGKGTAWLVGHAYIEKRPHQLEA
jgi:chloride channel protein, CIC family